MSGRFAASARLPRSGNAALATGALVQAAIGAEFVLAGLSKAVDPDFGSQFRAFVQASPGAQAGPLALVMQLLVVPNAGLMAELAKWTELVGGATLLLVGCAGELVGRVPAGRNVADDLPAGRRALTDGQPGLRVHLTGGDRAVPGSTRVLHRVARVRPLPRTPERVMCGWRASHGRGRCGRDRNADGRCSGRRLAAR